MDKRISIKIPRPFRKIPVQKKKQDAPCKNTNPLQLSGTSQLQRVLQALLPQSAPIDGRTFSDLILFAKEYAKYLQYYDADNAAQGDWQPFMQMDVAVVLATLAKQDMTLYETYRRGLVTEILSSTVEDDCKKMLESLFDVLFTYLYQLDKEYNLLQDGSDEKNYLQSIILGKLKNSCLQLTAYYNQAKAVSPELIDDSVIYIPVELSAPTAIQSAKYLLAQPLSNVWQGATPVIPAFSGTTIVDEIKNLVTHNPFNAVIDTIVKSIGAIADYSAKALDNSLTNFPKHSPHYALYLCFIQLFQYEQAQINSLTGEHLDFYYKQILQLKNNAAIGDNVHLVLQLQKNTTQLLIPSGTAFKAGKDADGKDIYYATQRDFTANQIAVNGLQSLLTLQKNNSSGNFTTLYASGIADSQDGDGAKLTSTDQSWFPFGSEKYTKNTAAVGFAVASSEMFLNEGGRSITLTVTFNKNIPAVPLLQNAFSIRVTGGKGWISPATVKVSQTDNTLSFVITIDASQPAVVGFNSAIHDGALNTSLPVMECMVNMQPGQYNPLQLLTGNQLQVNNITIATKVSGVKQFSVSTDTGAVDVSKPFMPFGATPHIGSGFVIGSKEIFGKNLTSLTIKIEWDNLPEFVGSPYVALGSQEAAIYYLENGSWVNENNDQLLFDVSKEKLMPYKSIQSGIGDKYLPGAIISFPTVSNFRNISCTLNTLQSLLPFDYSGLTNDAYAVNSKNGFMRLELSGSDFGHDAYLQSLLNVIINTDGTTQTISRPNPPYTPVIKSITIDYESSSNVDLTGNNAFSTFYHLYPFGYQSPVNNATIFPVFDNEGELYIGLDNVAAPQQVSVLFQLSEGSANPLKNKQPLTWSYLSSGNTWTDFDDSDIEDQTNGLLQSGLIIFNLPDDISANAALMGGSQAWLRAGVQQNSDAICKIISVQAQAIIVAFADIYNTGNYYKAPVPANTISKPVIGNPSIKNIVQPYASFGGTPREDDNAFYVRVSERLRHKHRAITIWDYERMVLQQFPDIYKVKCLNNTGMQPAPGNQPAQWNELYPGHVTLVPVPDLKNKNAVDPLLPYTSLGVLDNIQDYILQFTSPFVNVKAINPLFEQVQFNFSVRFFEQYDVTVYGSLLNDAITQFLCPWAFDGSKDIEFGGKISKSVVLKFIEDQYYVDYVTCFKMNHWIDVDNNKVLYDVEEAIATTSRSIFTSYHNADTGEQHIIVPILVETETCDCI